MRLRHKESERVYYSGSFNTTTVSPQEIIVLEPTTGEADSDYLKDYDCWLEERSDWKDLGRSIVDGDVAIDDYNQFFYEVRKS